MAVPKVGVWCSVHDQVVRVLYSIEPHLEIWKMDCKLKLLVICFLYSEVPPVYFFQLPFQSLPCACNSDKALFSILTPVR